MEVGLGSADLVGWEGEEINKYGSVLTSKCET